MAPKAMAWKPRYNQSGWLLEQQRQNQLGNDTWTSVGVTTSPSSTLRDAVEDEEAVEAPLPIPSIAVPDLDPVCPASFENVIITIIQISHDPHGNREMPLLSCVPRTEIEGGACSSQPCTSNQLSYDQLTDNIGWRTGKCLAYILPGQDDFRKIDNDSSFQAAVLRLRRAYHEDFTLYDVKDEYHRESSSFVCDLVMS